MTKILLSKLKQCTLIFFLVFLPYAANAEDDMDNIRNIYYVAQKAIEEGKTKSISFNSEAGKDGYEIKRWHLASEDAAYERGVYMATIYIVDGKIRKTNITMDSLSGDWLYAVEYFYYDDGAVAFIYEGTTTYNGYELVDDKPVSSGKLFVEERRSYYSKKGKRIKFLTKAFIKENGKAVDPGQVQDIEAENTYMTICELPFVDLLSRESISQKCNR